jgi:RNA polymerase sigma-70 factor, ECF subfamily
MGHDFRGTVMLMTAVLSNQIIASHTAKSGQIQETPDEALVSAIARGDQRAMHALYVRHNVRVYRFVLRLTADAALAEDIVSDVFLDVWRRAGTFKAKSRVSTWLLGIARNKALSALRARRHMQLDDRTAITIADPAEDGETMLEHRAHNVTIRECLSQLSTLHREVLDLVYHHDKSVKEVAEIVGVPASTVKTRMFHARKRMQALLETSGFSCH